MCQAFEPATSTQDKSLSTVGLPTRTTRRAVRSPAARFFSFSLFTFSFFFIFQHFFYSDLLLLLRYFYAVSVFLSICGTLLWFVFRFGFRYCFFFFFGFWRLYRAIFRGSPDPWILGYVSRQVSRWYSIPRAQDFRIFESVDFSRKSLGFQDRRILESSDQSYGRSRLGLWNPWILEFMDSEISRSPSPRIS